MAKPGLSDQMGASREDYIAIYSLLLNPTQAVDYVDRLIAHLMAHPHENVALTKDFVALLELTSDDGANLARSRIPDILERRAIRSGLAAQYPSIATFLARKGQL